MENARNVGVFQITQKVIIKLSGVEGARQNMIIWRHYVIYAIKMQPEITSNPYQLCSTSSP